MRTCLFAAVAALCLASLGYAGIDRNDLDPSTKPEDDFDQYANGGWKKVNPVPAAYSRWGSFEQLAERNRTAVHTILERARAAERPTPVQKRVGAFYASAMDEAAIEAAGLTPLEPELARIAALKDPAQLPAVLARLHRYGIEVGFAFTSEQDPGDTARMVAVTRQAGLGLPDRDYYLREDEKSRALRQQYRAHVARLFALAGEDAAAAHSGADVVVKLETALATASRTNVALRDPVANYHKRPVAELTKFAPHFDWPAYFHGLGIAAPAELDVAQPEFLQAFDGLLVSVPVDEWRTYLRWHLLHAASPYLSTTWENETFAFYERELTGAQQLQDRWKRAFEAIDEGLGEDMGQLYVAENFPPESKARMLVLVENLREALRDRLQALAWMDDATREKALAKLAAFRVKIGYPDKWIDYGALQVDRGPYVLNVLRAAEFNVARELAKIGQPVDRSEWGMTPPTVNAYYNPTMNEIVFPAGILQPPFFDAEADDALNYGGIGAVIGHEMIHGFDDEGRQYAADGSLTEWWTPESARRFEERAAGIVRQFSGYVPVDALHVNGELTQGENIADLGGLRVAYGALQKALSGRPRAKIDGFTPEQRFFLSWAKVWRENIRPEALRLRVNTDPHAPAHFRINGPLSNLEEFAVAFAVPEGAPMRRSGEQRVTIW